VRGIERQRDQPHVAALRVLTQRLRELIAAHIEQSEIEQDDVGLKASRDRQCGVA
jgi:hypothetical protein